VDTVPHGGDYDGVAGVSVALELLRSASEDGFSPLPVELVVFAEEEGTTFGLGMLGSRAWVGDVSAEQLEELRNADGETYLEAGEQYGVDPDKLGDDRLKPEKYLGMIEVHIEQGPGMWQRGQQVAVVSAIAGRRQFHVTIKGQANHAGATSMTDRRDALAGAAACIVGLEKAAREAGRGSVATVGRIENHPNAINVIPDRVEFTVDFRSGDDAVLDGADALVRGLIEDVCRRRGLTAGVKAYEHIPARPMDDDLVRRLSRAGGRLPVTVSGALHDCGIVATRMPAAMLFVPSTGGISHNPAEFSSVEDIAAAAAVVEKLVRRPTVRQVNAMRKDAFVALCGRLFEQSPWVAERAWEKRPFSSWGDLHDKLTGALRSAKPEEQLAVIQAHPDLVGGLSSKGGLTPESAAEQAAAGLGGLSPEEVAAFERHNAAYREKFGFPFVICARENRKEAILAAFPQRLQNTREQEVAAALAEVEKIARLRLVDAVWED
jgi:OHCU decarboxylase